MIDTPRRGIALWCVVMVWIPAVLWLDRGASPAGQLLLGAVTWALLIGVLVLSSPMIRAQAAVVIVFATAVEYVFSGWLGVYEYRLGEVPAYVPPGHGLVYLAALGFGTALAAGRRRLQAAAVATIAVGGVAALWGLVLSPRPDALGAFWYACLVGFLIWGRNRGLYVGAFIVVTWLEVLGTVWGVWTWMPYDTILGIVSIGNPPSVAAGGYGWFDLAAVAAAPAVLAAWAAARRRMRMPSRPVPSAEQLQHRVVEPAVAGEPAP